MPTDLKALKARYDMRQVLPGERRSNDKYDLMSCPWHKDTTPSAMVFADGVNCLAGCGQHDIIDWVMLSKSCSFKEAVDYLLTEQVDLQGLTAPRTRASRVVLPPVTEELIEKTKSNLPKNALVYWLVYRQVTGSTFAFSKVGYYRHASKGWGGRFAIPIYDIDRKPVGFKLRRDDTRDQTGARWLTWTGMGARLYLGYPAYVERASVVVITEGEADALALLTKADRGWRKLGEAYYPDVWPVAGTTGCGTWQSEWSERLATAKEIVIAYDNDEAGRMGAAKLKVEHLPRARILPPEVYLGYKDITEVIRNGGGDQLLRSIHQG